MSFGVSLPSTSSSESPDHSSNSLKEDQIEEKGQGGNEESSDKTTTLRYSSVSLMGRRREMEDVVMVAGKYAFFGAYDGRRGDGVANACRKRMRELLENELEANVEKPPGDEQTTSSCGSGKIDWKKEMAECFSRADDEVLNNMWDTDAWVAEEAVGSRAVVVMAGKEEVVVAANCGDSRAVLCRGGVVIPLSNCHQV